MTDGRVPLPESMPVDNSSTPSSDPLDSVATAISMSDAELRRNLAELLIWVRETRLAGAFDSSYLDFRKDALNCLHRMDGKLRQLNASYGLDDDSKPQSPDLWGVRFELPKEEADAYFKKDYCRIFYDRVQEGDNVRLKATAFKLSGTTLRVLAGNQADGDALFHVRNEIPRILEFTSIDPDKNERPVMPRYYIALFGFVRSQEFLKIQHIEAQENMKVALKKAYPEIVITDVQLKHDHIVVVVASKENQTEIVRSRVMCLFGQSLAAFKWDLRCESFTCHKCQISGHRRAYCEKPTRCPYCSEGHEIHNCDKKTMDEKMGSTARKQCPNCAARKLANPSLDIDTNHAAYDRQCKDPETMEMRQRAARFRRYQMNLPAYLVNAMAEIEPRPSSAETRTANSTQGRTTTTARKARGGKATASTSTEGTKKAAAKATARSKTNQEQPAKSSSITRRVEAVNPECASAFSMMQPPGNAVARQSKSTSSQSSLPKSASSHSATTARISISTTPEPPSEPVITSNPSSTSSEQPPKSKPSLRLSSSSSLSTTFASSSRRVLTPSTTSSRSASPELPGVVSSETNHLPSPSSSSSRIRTPPPPQKPRFSLDNQAPPPRRLSKPPKEPERKSVRGQRQRTQDANFAPTGEALERAGIPRTPAPPRKNPGKRRVE